MQNGTRGDADRMLRTPDWLLENAAEDKTREGYESGTNFTRRLSKNVDL
jgi:hypothetical protein